MLALLIILVVLGAIVFLVVGVEAKYESGRISAAVKIGPVKVNILSAWEPGAGHRRRKEKKQKKEAAGEEPEKDRKVLDAGFIKELIPLGLDTLGKFRRKLSIDLLAFRFKAGRGDPYDTIMQYGRVSALLGVVLPLFTNAFSVRESDICTDFDFNADKPEIFAHIIISFAIWEMLYIGFSFGIGFLKLYLKRRKKHKHEAGTEEPETEPTST